MMAAPPTLALMPGLDGTGTLFQSLLRELPAEQTAIVLSYPPDPSASYVELAEIALAQIPRAKPFVLVAESFSGPLAVSLAARRPTNLRGIVLCASFLRSPLHRLSTMLLSIAAPTLARLPLPRFALERLLLTPAASEELQDLVSRTVNSIPPQVLAARLRSIAQIDVLPLAAEVTVPLLYIRATQDRLVDHRAAELALKAFTESSLVDIQAPHLVLQSAPSESARAISNFCSTLEPKGSATQQAVSADAGREGFRFTPE